MNIQIIYSPIHKKHNPPYELYDGVRESYAEKPDRIESILTELRRNGFENIMSPHSFSMKYIYSVHKKEYVSFLQKRARGLEKNQILFSSYFIMDTYTPIVRGTFLSAKESVDIALTGARKVLGGSKLVYALCRPPGHHAQDRVMGGYCYFNNAAIAAQFLSQKGKVAILDIDFHHGNGTQQIFYNRSDVLYISLHADPFEKYPYISGFKNENGEGKGYGFTKNYPLPLQTNETQYRKVLRKALSDIVRFNPVCLVVSCGFDTYIGDPIGGFNLEIPFFKTMGSDIYRLNLPTLIVQEGGYNILDLGKLAVSFLKGMDL